MDQMVLLAQQWVNAQYGSVPGYNPCTEDGHTGWETMFSLTRGLQHELGITALSDNFGPTTLGRLTSYGTVSSVSNDMNMRIIAEAALYCKGYEGGQIDGGFGGSTQAGLTALLQNMGVPPAPFPALGIEPKVFKALLTMDAYVIVGGGDAKVQACQRWLNGTYYGRAGFFIGPCDGNFSRSVQSSLVLAIQYQLGMSDAQVTGAVGPGTENGLRTQAYVGPGSQDSGPTGWVRLFQCAVQFNNRDSQWGDGGGTYTTDLAAAVRGFQEFCELPPSGAGDYQTWMSLLLSTGDPDRVGSAFDCMLPMNNTTVQTVKNNGYRIVGRYLTGGTNKVLTNSEIALLNDNGLSFFPIYQENGDAVDYFDYQQGNAAGVAACAAARGFGLPHGTVLYIAVDFDALDDEITSNVIPHFEGVRDAVAADGNFYAVGVYGCRNTCIRLAAAGLASRSFVSGMSTGYSGNLGFPLPANWAFDQIANKTLAAGTGGAVEIDNDLVSGRDLGIDSVTRPRDPNDGFHTLLVWLEARAGQWRDQGHTDRYGPELVAQYLRTRGNFQQYAEADLIFGSLDTDFITFVNNYQGRPDITPLRDPKYLWDCDVAHFGESFGAVINHALLPDPGTVSRADFGCWGGDLLTVLGQFVQSGLPDSQAYSFAHDLIGDRSTESTLSMSDLIADVDAMMLGLATRADPSIPLSQRFADTYASPATSAARYASFYTQRFNGSTTVARTAAQNLFSLSSEPPTLAATNAFWALNYAGPGHLYPSDLPATVTDGVAQAFADTVAALPG